MSKKKLARAIGVCAIAIMIIVVVTILPSCGSPPTPPTYGLEFDGVDDYIEIPHDASLDDFDELSITLWMYPTAVGGNYTRRIIDKGWSADGGFVVFLDKKEFPRLCFTVDTSLGNTDVYYALPDINRWYHVVATWSCSSYPEIYVGGVLVATGSTIRDEQLNYESWIRIGGAANRYQGIASEVHFYNRALSAAEIEDIYRHQDVTDGLIGYWKLNEGSGTIAHDSTANNNTGTLVGDPVWFTGGG